MLEIINCEQNSPEWDKARCGVITASAFKDVLAKGQGKTRRTYMLKLAGERITGESADSFSNVHTERGHELEGEILNLYQEHTGNTVEKCGFMQDVFGYSPDGLVGDDGLFEAKLKLAHIQAEILLKDEVPSEHKAQLQGGLMVSARKWIDFTSYCPGMPIFIKRVFRDEQYIAGLRIELQQFEEELQDVVNQIMEKF